MSSHSFFKDLVLLVADKNMEYAVMGLLSRPQAVGIRPLDYDLFVHPERDPGCLLKSHDFLRPQYQRYSRALVIFDLEGCGKQEVPRVDLENEVEKRLVQSGWGDRAATIVIDPELEAWAWVDSPHLDSALGWHGKDPGLCEWLAQTGFLAQSESKPANPKNVVEEALRLARKPRSSSLYRHLAERVTLQNCSDPAFQKFKRTISMWFPPTGRPKSETSDVV